MSIKFTLLIVLISLSTLINAQVPNRFENKKDTSSTNPAESSTPIDPKEKPSIMDKLVYGGNFTLSFGSNTFIYAAPAIGYKISEKLVTGTGFSYMFIHIKNYYYNNVIIPVDIKNSTYGPKFFVSYFPFEKYVYLGSQYEILNHNVPLFNHNGLVSGYEKQWTPVLFVEAGYTEKIGNKGFMQMGIRYNLLHDYDSPYGVAWFPVLSIFF